MSAESVRFDRAAGFYDATRGLPPGVDLRVARLLLEEGGLGPDSRVLEVGIGTGRIALPLARLGPTVCGVDLSRPMLDRLRARRTGEPVHVVLADATRLPHPDRSFDAAITVHVFHLIPGWRALLGELARVLRPGALLLNGGEGPNPLWGGSQRLLEGKIHDVGVPRDRIFDFLEEEGWRPRGERRRLGYPFATTPRHSLELLEARSPSCTWRLSDAELETLLAEARQLALERCGSLDTRVELEREFLVRAHRPPTSG